MTSVEHAVLSVIWTALATQTTKCHLFIFLCQVEEMVRLTMCAELQLHHIKYCQGAEAGDVSSYAMSLVLNTQMR